MTIMGGIAELERGLIRKRCEEGIRRAKCKGTKFGRPNALDPSQKQMIADRHAEYRLMSSARSHLRFALTEGCD
jgi:DNA invertase Pin-like site-specific DNA recombinase